MATIRDLAKKVRDEAKKNRESSENKARQDRLSNATLSSNTAFTSAAKPQAELSKPAKITSDVSGEAWTRATPSQTVIPEKTVISQTKMPSGYTPSQEQELSRLSKLRQEAAVNLDADTMNELDAQMKAIRAQAGKQTFGDRVTDVLTAIGAGSMGQYANAVGFVNNAFKDPDYNRRQIARMQESLKTGVLSDGKPVTPAMRKTIQESIDRMTKEIEEWEAEDSTTNRIYRAADRLGEESAKATASAKEGLGSVGNTVVDAAVSMGQSTLDAVPALVTGGAAGMAPFVVRAFGGATQEARQKGASMDEQLLYGTAEAAKEYVTEKLFGLTLPQKMMGNAGKGLADASVEGLIDAGIKKALGRIESEFGQKAIGGIATWLASGVTEGAEEIIGSAIENAFINPNLRPWEPDTRTRQQKFEDALYDGLVGAVSGLMGGVTNLATYDTSKLNPTKNTSSGVTVDAQNQSGYNETKVSPASSAQVQQTEAQAQVTRAENPGSTVLDAATTLFTQQGMKLKTAQEKAGIVQKLIAGEEVSVRDINKLNPTSRDSQAIFTQLTGVQFPEGKVTQEQLYNLYRSANQVAVDAREQQRAQQAAQEAAFQQAAAEQVQAMQDQQTPTAQQYIAQHTGENDAQAVSRLAQMRGEIAPDGNALLSFKEFSDFIKQQNPKATREATARLYDQYLKDNQTVEYRGQRLSHMQFMDMVRNAPTGSELTEAEAEDLWQREVKRQQDLNYNKEDSNGRGEDLVHSAGLSGVSDQSAGGQGSGVSEAAGRAEGDGGTRRGNQTGSRAGQSRESVSEEVSRKTGGGFRELRIGDQAVTEVLPEVYTPEMQTAVERFNGTSANVHVVLEGYPIPGTSSFADGITIRQKDGRIDVYLQATSRLSLEGRANHELSHVAMFDNPEVKYQAIRALKESTSEQELEDLVVAYQTMYGNAYADSDDLIGDLLEEIVCDAYAGLNRANAGAPKYRSAVSAALDPQMQTYTAAYRESLALTDDSGNLVVESDDKGHSRFSLRTFKDSGREILDKWMRRAVVKGDLTQQDADDILSTIDTIYDVCEKYKDDYGPFSVWSGAKVVTDEKGNPVFSVVKANGDYSMNLDFSLVCKKRRTLDAVLNELVQRGFADNLALGQEDIVKINDVIREHGFETACALCFVDAKRFRQGKVADDFVKLYNDMVLSLIPENSGFEAQYFNFGGDSTITAVSNPIDQMPNSQLDFTHINEVLKTYGSKTVEHKVAKLLKNSAQDRKLTKRGDFLSTRGFDAINRQNPRVLKLFNAKKGSGGPKSAVSDVQYLNEVLKPNSFKQEKAYAVGGVRIQSFSDYVPRMVFDYVQMIADLSAKKLPAHAYTKEELFVKQFGLTGMKINMSLIPKVVDDGIAAGLDADGNYAWADESFDYDEALKIQSAEGYSRNCGTIAVGVSDEHIRALMADPDIRMVIPYHKSGLNPIVAKMNKIEAFTDYTDYQNTRHKDGTKLNPDNAVDKKLLKEAPNFNQRLHELGENGDPRQVVDEYVKWCEDNDLLPKFDQFLYQQVDGVFVEQDGHKVIDPNYYKLIEDFTVYDGDSYVAQGPLSMSFPTEDSAFGSMAELIKRGLEEDAVLEGKRDSEVGAIVDEIIRGSRTTDAAMQDDSGMAFYDTEKKYSVLVEDKDTLDFLNNQKTIKTYKTMQLVDGKLYPPMASRINGKFEDASELGKWEQATEHPELIKNGNKFKLDKGKGNGSIEAAYNPYMHSSNLVINDQFTGAYTRDNLVTVECEVPVSEVTSGYHAEYAKDSVGWHSWHTGTVAGQIRKEKGIERQVFLSRWIKPVRIVPDSEVASMYKTLLDGTDIAVPDNVVTPSLRNELQKAGVKLQESGRVRYSITEYTDEQKREHDAAALKYFGNTDNWNETGYLTLDGKKLDFSGRHDGAPGGYRTVDHRDVSDALGLDYGGGDYSGAMVQFMAEGNIRISPESNGINLSVLPTEAQERALEGYISRARGEVILDIDDTQGNTISSTEYPKGTRASKVLSDIRQYFKDGTEPYVPNTARYRYSITQDSTGRELTKEQQEFFKDSKVRDAEGRLTPVYHGTPNGGFTEFKLPKYMSSLMSSYGPGFYFTDKNNARQYMKPVNKSKIPGTRAKLYETYLNITNPFEMSGYQHTLTKDQVVEILKNGNYDWFFEKGMFHELGLEPGSLSREDVIEQYADKLLRSQYGDQDVISEIVKAYTGEDNNILDVLKKVTGNDGLHWKDGYGDIWVAWDANQIKNVSNKKPTESTDIRYSITPEFEQWYKENFGGEDLTDAQLQRRLEYAKQKEADVKSSQQAAKTKQDVDQRYKDLTAWMMYHERKMREQRQALKDRSKAVQQSLKADKKDALQKQAEIHKAELAVARDEKVKALKDQDLAWRIYSQQQTRNAAADKAEALKTARKEANAEKAEAVRTTKEAERAKAEMQHDADMMAMKREAAKRLRVKEDAYQQKAEQRKENQKLKRNAAKQALRDSKLAAKKRAEAEVKQGAVDTIRKNPASRSAVEKLQERASQLRTLGRSAYRTFVNQALHIDELAKRQVEGTRASTLVTVLGGANDTVATIYKNGLVDRAGNTIGESMKDVFLCWDIKGKKVDQNKQALLQDYMLHQHNVDRMSFVDRARTRLETFEQENPWLSQMDTKEFARLVAMTDAEIQSTGKQEAHDKAVQYARLLHEYDTAQNKPIFGDSDGNAVTADTSRKIVQQYLSENPWLEEKAQGIYDWWDKFMRTWAVGDSITEAEYNTMRELYPHYVPTYRADKKGVGAANFVGANGASIGKAVKKAKGGMSEVLNIEDSFSNLVSKIVRLERTNELYMNMIDSAMLDNDDTFSDMIVFDWDWQDGQYGKTLEIGALLNGDLDARYDDAEAAGLSKVGQDRKLTAWHNGRQYSAYISEDLFKSIANVTGTVANDLEKNLIKLGNTLTGPMKTAITGINPTFALRNVSRDLPTAITNSISGLAFPKYWAQAAAEIAKNSENWQHFQALGGTNATYYNDQNGFVKSMEQRDGIGAKAVSAMGAFNEVTEAQTRFAEYLATIDRLGDTYENRLLGIKNAAEVTVDFSRKGRAGKLINAWVPYWNPAVQGVDKVVRSVIDSPDGSAVWKQAVKTVGRASMTTVLFEAILYAVLKGMGRYDDWEELDDRTKDTYYCIPYGKSNTFIKVPKNREWGAILGTPLMRMLEYANGRENPFENYIETSLEPNFLPGQILAPREGGGWQSDVIGFSQALDLQANKDFAGRTIVPYAYQQGSITQQYDENTSWFSKKLGDLLNFSPMQIDYIIKDYFGDFGDLAVSATSDAVLKGTESLPEKATDLLTGSFKTDNRYSNYTVSKYYDTLEKLEQTVQDRKNQMEGDSYQDTVEYQTKSALDKLYGKQISELNKQVRNSTDQEERDNLKGQIAELAGQALEYYQDCMSGKVENPVLDAQYANLPSAVSKELIRLDGYSKDYGIKPTGNPSAKYTDPKNKNKEYVLTDEQKDKFKDIYQEQYAQTFSKVIGSSKYKSASDEKKANLLENARDDVLEDTKDEFFKWLKKTGAKSTAKKK